MLVIKNKGFSLIELMIVVAIVGILSLIAIPSYNKYMLRTKLTELINVSVDDYKKVIIEKYPEPYVSPINERKDVTTSSTRSPVPVTLGIYKNRAMDPNNKSGYSISHVIGIRMQERTFVTGGNRIYTLEVTMRPIFSNDQIKSTSDSINGFKSIVLVDAASPDQMNNAGSIQWLCGMSVSDPASLFAKPGLYDMLMALPKECKNFISY